MQALEKTVAVPGKHIRVIPFGDVHTGVIHCDEEKFKRDIRSVAATPFEFGIFIGDNIDAINPSDRRFDSRVLLPEIPIRDISNITQHQIARFLDMADPLIAHGVPSKVLWWVKGNHEDTVLKHYHHDLMDDICARVGMDRTKEVIEGTALCRLNVVSEELGDTFQIDFHIQHGRKTATSSPAALKLVQKSAERSFADVYLQGHVHHRVGEVVNTVGFGKDENGEPAIIKRQQCFVVTGGYLKTYARDVVGYAEQAGYSPVDIGSQFFEMNLETGQMFTAPYEPEFIRYR